jgi:putative ABC transport system permease protein
MIQTWIGGLIAARGRSLTAAAFGVAVAVALLALLGLFVAHSASTMTARAVLAVSPDWQVQLTGTTDAAGTVEAIGEVAVGTKIEPVDFADIKALTAMIGGTVQTTGYGKAVGIGTAYEVTFPRQLRLLAGSFDGALLAQQTAANLHAGPGDPVAIERLGAPSVTVTIAGIVEMPSADQFFQVVGAPTGATPIAPPDNVILLPDAKWQELFNEQLEAMPQTAQRQLHVAIDHARLASDPVTAYVDATGKANNLSAKLAGEGMIANNLAARLDGVRLDALFAKVLFMFLGVPGAIVAVLLTMLIVLSGADRRRREIALLQIRGASPAQALTLIGLEAVLVGASGAIAGSVMASIIARNFVALPSGMSEARWYAAAAACGMIAALVIFVAPSWAAVHRTASDNLKPIEKHSDRVPAWKRLWLDVVLLAIASLVFWQSAATGYRVVTAPEGVATATVDYKAYIAPGLMWIGLALLLMRAWTAFMKHGRPVLRVLLAPVAQAFAGIVAASLSRERLRIAKGVVLVALAFSFATSTAIFNTTYEKQAGVDAALTNGADVAVTGTVLSPASAALDKIEAVPGISWAEPMQHRFAYVGTDLQDLYGISPTTIGKATAMSNAYFASNDAKGTLEQLKATPNGVLVSDETVTDFQLRPGDTLNLRLQSGSDKAYHSVPFTFIGVVREFPTAPTDSFLVANASYVAQATGLSSAETVLVHTSATPSDVAKGIRTVLGNENGLKVTDVSEASHRIGSSLVAVDLKSLTGLELAFALPIIAGAVGLVFALGLEERRRNFAILLALGAKARHLGAFLWSEALIIYAVGITAGVAMGSGLAWVLVKMMTHVFDPPPDALTVPWSYLALLALTGLAAVCISVLLQLRKRAEPLSFAIRKL